MFEKRKACGHDSVIDEIKIFNYKQILKEMKKEFLMCMQI